MALAPLYVSLSFRAADHSFVHFTLPKAGSTLFGAPGRALSSWKAPADPNTSSSQHLRGGHTMSLDTLSSGARNQRQQWDPESREGLDQHVAKP
jgi:hypothetical protein